MIFIYQQEKMKKIQHSSTILQYLNYLIENVYTFIKIKNRQEDLRIKSILKLKSMFGSNAYNKRVPEFIKRLPNAYKRSFIQGYLDSDGSVFYDNGKVRVNFTSVNLQLMEDVQDMLFGMKIANSIVIHQKECVSRHGIHSEQSYRINISRADQYQLQNTPVFESRK